MTLGTIARGGMVVAQGHQLFAEGLLELATRTCNQRLSAIAAEISEPLRVAVQGRRGVGRRTVAAALRAAGLPIPEQSDVIAGADLVVYVVAEVVKPEDVAALGALCRHPVLVVLNKADLPGHCGVATARTVTAKPAEPMSALFALAALGGSLDERMWAYLRGASEHAGAATSRDLAQSGGATPQAHALLRRASGVDAVVSRLETMSAGQYHRRLCEAVTRLEVMAVADSRIDEFLVADASVAARLLAAEAVVDVVDEPALERARRWQAYRSAPIGPAQRACAADIARGSLRVWAAARSPG